jgi:hypothetical protein
LISVTDRKQNKLLECFMQNKKEDSVFKMEDVKSIKKVFLACIEE